MLLKPCGLNLTKSHALAAYLNNWLCWDILLLQDCYNSFNRVFYICTANDWPLSEVVLWCVRAYKSTWWMLGPPRKWLHPAAMYRIPPCWRKESEPQPIASPFAPLKRLHCSQKSEARECAKGSYEARRWGRGWPWWVLGRCLKPHRGEGARHRASLCNSQPTVGALPQLNSTVWKTPQHDTKNTPNCQGAQLTQRF